MPKRIAVNTLVLSREGKRVTVKPGQAVDLTSDEINQLKPMGAIRLPVNETAAAETEDEAPKTETPAKPATAGKATGEKAAAKKDEDL